MSKLVIRGFKKRPGDPPPSFLFPNYKNIARVPFWAQREIERETERDREREREEGGGRREEKGERGGGRGREGNSTPPICTIVTPR
jgi:hypothetical protein